MSLFDMSGQVALITGSSRGIGRAIAARFVTEGALVVVADTEAGLGPAVVDALGGPAVARFVVADIARKPDAQRAVAAAVEAFGGLDILVQNAGIYPWTLIENIEPDEWDAVLGVNLRGTFLAAQAALPVMRAIGVPEIAAYLAGECSLEQAESRGSQATRNYAKRQYTWLHNQTPPDWPRITGDTFDLEQVFETLLRN